MLSDHVWPECVVEVDVAESQIRQDGNLNVRATVHSHHVAVAFDSRHGPLRYECGTYSGTYREPGWRWNVRAIALSLEALRAVQRWGIGVRGEAYTGWAALGPGAPYAMSAGMDRHEAMRLIEEGANLASGVISNHRGDHSFNAHVQVAYRRAAKNHHPDAGGDAAVFAKLAEAYALLTGETA
jgi:hypothetical protein